MNMMNDAASNASPVEIQKALKGVKYPASKNSLIDTVTKNGASGMIIDIIKKIKDKEYKSPAEVTKEIGKM